MELRRFGPTKFQVPVIGQGTWRHGATPRQVALRFLVRKPELARIDAAFPLGPRGRELPML
jgi:hypothetical protein